MEDEHRKYRLTLEQAKKQIKAVDMQAASPFTYIYLFIFDLEDKLIGVDLIRPDDPKPNLFWSEILSNDYGKNNIYLIIKVKEFEDYFEGVADSEGTMAKAQSFMKAWKEQKSVGDNPALKRYTIEYTNYQLGLPFRYSKEQRDADMTHMKHEIRKDIPWWRRIIFNIFGLFDNDTWRSGPK